MPESDKNEINLDLVAKNLIIGDILSYKELCNKLNQPIYGGNQKKYQLKEFKRYFDFENVNRKIIITDIYKNPSIEEAKNAIYVKYIECVLLDYLSKQKDYKIYISRTRLWLLLGVITENYVQYNKNREELKNIDEKMTDFEINDFFKRCNNNFPKIIDSSLNSLQRRCLIKYSKPYMIVEKDKNENLIYREATDLEISYILKVKRKVMKQFNVEIEIQIYWNGQEEEYYDVLNKIFKEEQGWEGIYTCYKIVYDQENALEAFSKDAVKLCKLILNEKVIKRMNTQANNLALEKMCSSDKNFQYPKCYPDMQSILSDKLLKLEDIEGLMKRYLDGEKII